jgi:hypothetical protein
MLLKFLLKCNRILWNISTMITAEKYSDLNINTKDNQEWIVPRTK